MDTTKVEEEEGNTSLTAESSPKPFPRSPFSPSVEHTRYLTVELIVKLLKGQTLEEAKSLRVTLPGKGEKIQYIENLEKLPNLEHLNLRHHKIAKIENLNKLVKLKELNISHNLITKLENLSSLFRLEVLDLSNNKITRIPASISELKRLRALLLSDNSLAILQDVSFLRECGNLTILDLRNNPIIELPGCRSYTIFQLPQLEVLDNQSITTEEREEATVRWNRQELLECEAQLKAAKQEIDQLNQTCLEKTEEIRVLERRCAQLRVAQEVDRARLAELEPKLERVEASHTAKTNDLVRAVDDLYTLRHQFELLKIELAFLVDMRDGDEEPPTPSRSRLDRTDPPRFHDPQLAALVLETAQQVQEVRNVLIAHSHNVSRVEVLTGSKGRCTPVAQGLRGITPARFTPLMEEAHTHGDHSFTRYSTLFDTSAIAGESSFESKSRGSRQQQLKHPREAQLQEELAALETKKEAIQRSILALQRQEKALCSRCNAELPHPTPKRPRACSAPPSPKSTPGKELVHNLTMQVEELKAQNSVLVDSMQGLRAEEQRRMEDLHQLHQQVASFARLSQGPSLTSSQEGAGHEGSPMTLRDLDGPSASQSAESGQLRINVDALTQRAEQLQQQNAALDLECQELQTKLQTLQGQCAQADHQLHLMAAEQISREEVHQEEVEGIQQCRAAILADLAALIQHQNASLNAQTQAIVSQRDAILQECELARQEEAAIHARIEALQEQEDEMDAMAAMGTPIQDSRTDDSCSSPALDSPSEEELLPNFASTFTPKKALQCQRHVVFLVASVRVLQDLHSSLGKEVRAMLACYNDLVFDNENLESKCHEKAVQLAALMQEIRLAHSQLAAAEAAQNALQQSPQVGIRNAAHQRDPETPFLDDTPSADDPRATEEEYADLQAQCLKLRRALADHRQEWEQLQCENEQRQVAAQQRRQELIEEENYLQQRCFTVRVQLQSLAGQYNQLCAQFADLTGHEPEDSTSDVDICPSSSVDPKEAEALGLTYLKDLQDTGLALMKQEQQVRLRLRLLCARLDATEHDQSPSPENTPRRLRDRHHELLQEAQRLDEVILEVHGALQQASAEEDQLKGHIAAKRASYAQICSHIAQLQAAHHKLVTACAGARQKAASHPSEDHSADDIEEDRALSTQSMDSIAIQTLEDHVEVLRGEEAQLSARVQYLQTLEAVTEAELNSLRHKEELMKTNIARLADIQHSHQSAADPAVSPFRPKRAPVEDDSSSGEGRTVSSQMGSEPTALNSTAFSSPGGAEQKRQEEVLQRLSVLQRELMARQQRLQDLHSEEAQAQQQLDDITAQVTSRQQQLEEYRLEQNTLMQLIDTLRQQWSEKHVQVQVASAELQATEERSVKVREALEAEELKLKDLQERCARAQQKLQEQEGKLAQCAQEEQRAMDRLNEACTQLERQRQELQRCQAEHEAVQQAIAEQRQQLQYSPPRRATSPHHTPTKQKVTSPEEGLLRQQLGALQEDLGRHQQLLMKYRQQEDELRVQLKALEEEGKEVVERKEAVTQQWREVQNGALEEQQQLHVEIAALRTEKAALAAEIQEECVLHATQQQTITETADAQERLLSLHEEVQEMEDRLDELVQQETALQLRVEKLANDEQQCFRRLQEAYQTHDWLEAEMTVARTRLNAMRSTYSSGDVSGVSETLTRESHSTLRELESSRLQQQVDVLEQRMSERISEMTFLDAITRRVADLRLEEQELRQTVDTLRRTKSHLEVETAALQQKVQDSQVSLRRMQDEYAEAERQIRRLDQQTVLDLRLEEKELRQTTENLRRMRANLGTEVATLQQQLRETEAALQQAQGDFTETERRLRHLDHQNEKLTAAIKKGRTEKEQLSKVSEEVQQLQQLKEELEGQVCQLRSSANALSQTASQSSRIDRAKKTLKHMAQQLHATKLEYNELLAQVESLRTQKAQLWAEKMNSNTAVNNTEQKVDLKQLQQEEERLRAINERLQTEGTRLQSYVDTLNHTVKALCGNIDSLHVEEDGLVQRLQTLRSMEHVGRAFLSSLQREEGRLMGQADILQHGARALLSESPLPLDSEEAEENQLAQRIHDLRVLEHAMVSKLERLQGEMSLVGKAKAADIAPSVPQALPLSSMAEVPSGDASKGVSTRLLNTTVDLHPKQPVEDPSPAPSEAPIHPVPSCPVHGSPLQLPKSSMIPPPHSPGKWIPDPPVPLGTNSPDVRPSATGTSLGLDSVVPVPVAYNAPSTPIGAPSPWHDEGESLRSPESRSPPAAVVNGMPPTLTTRVHIELERRPRNSSRRHGKADASPVRSTGSADRSGMKIERAHRRRHRERSQTNEGNTTAEREVLSAAADQVRADNAARTLTALANEPVSSGLGPGSAHPTVSLPGAANLHSSLLTPSAVIHSALSATASVTAGGHRTYHRHFHYIHDHTKAPGSSGAPSLPMPYTTL